MGNGVPRVSGKKNMEYNQFDDVWSKQESTSRDHARHAHSNGSNDCRIKLSGKDVDDREPRTDAEFADERSGMNIAETHPTPQMIIVRASVHLLPTHCRRGQTMK
ncbi:hypothetical protein WR25_21114 [Diploscapter pachys]|uniref:Uncharacterized protein n=1 Tax=Diploscapter pachys TaxID=2018661 RepID=A0A2A2KTR4_9BILA|nr:hypothetical protein WR25_21114 [Diploscapter pachys]